MSTIRTLRFPSFTRLFRLLAHGHPLVVAVTPHHAPARPASRSMRPPDY